MGQSRTAGPAGKPPPSGAPPWSRVGLLAILLLDVWLRGHTFGPLIRDRLGVDPYLVTAAEGEPLDCDEAIYAYYGRRIGRGAVLYRDLAEPKPPGGYWLYALAVAIGGANEGTVRLLPIPIVLATIALVWWIALRLAGPGPACLAALIYAVASTDPYLHGNGSNLEHPINLLATASLALMLHAFSRPGRWGIAAAGAGVGAACLFKQVVFTHLVVYGIALLARRRSAAGGGGQSAGPRAVRARVLDLTALLAGFALPLLVAAAVLVGQGAGRSAVEDVIRYGAAMAAQTPPPPQSPPGWARLVVGNSDPRNGSLPWPFGLREGWWPIRRTDYLMWWGTGTWPLWLMLFPALGWLLAGRGNAPRRLVAAWTLSAAVQVALPGLFWAHYYLLPLPGLAVGIAVLAGDLARGARGRRLGLAIILAGVAWMGVIQRRDYLHTPPQELGARYKGGGQWIGQRRLGREFARRAAGMAGARLFVWGTSSPLFVYSRLDGVSRYAFADPLMQAKAATDPGHPLIRPRLDRIMADLRAHPPEILFAADPPFPELRAFLQGRYRPWRGHAMSAAGQGVWIERRAFGAFTADRSARRR